MTESNENTERNSRKVRIGYVVSDKMEKTIVVELEDRVKHSLYGKIIRTTSKVKAHDEDGVAGVGDRVRIMETRPLSASKHWRLVEVLEKDETRKRLHCTAHLTTPDGQVVIQAHFSGFPTHSRLKPDTPASP